MMILKLLLCSPLGSRDRLQAVSQPPLALSFKALIDLLYAQWTTGPGRFLLISQDVNDLFTAFHLPLEFQT